MNDIAIRVEGISKQYHIGGPQRNYDRIGEQVVDMLMTPLRRASKLVQGQATGAAELDETIWALKDISFEVKRGEIVGIIGRNGAGKSTLLKILSRITDPTEGEATIYGRVGSLLEVGTGFHPELSGRENVYLNGSILGMRKAEIERKFHEIVDFAEIEKFIDTPVKHYSSGMYVRLAFAVAAHLEPEILIIDEVLAVGDVAFQQKCLGKMDDVANEGRTVLFVSHNMGTVAELTERCLLLHNGEIEADGLTTQVIEEYLLKADLALSRDTSNVEAIVQSERKTVFNITHVKIIATEHGLVAGQPFEVELDYTSYENLENVMVGIGIANAFGTRLISCNSNDDGTVISTKKSETGIITARIDHPYLVSGRYILQVVVMQSNKTLSYIDEALHFELKPNIHDQWALHRRNLGVRLPSRWTHSKNRGNDE